MLTGIFIYLKFNFTNYNIPDKMPWKIMLQS